MSFITTYTQQHGPEATSWDEYAEETQRAYRDLLDSNPKEGDVQHFLEHHPCLAPGAWTPGTKSGHYPLHCALSHSQRFPASGAVGQI